MAAPNGREAGMRREKQQGGRSRHKRRDSGSSDSFLDKFLKRSSHRFALAISSIVEKYNFPFEDDKLISINSLMYNTPDGPKVWGEESEEENKNNSDELPEEEQSMNSCEESPSGTDFKNNSEISSIKRYLEDMHLKENIHLGCHPGAEVDLLVNDDAYTVPGSPMVLRRESKNVPEELVNESLHGYCAVVPRKQGHNGYSDSMSLQLYNSTAKDSADELAASGNLSLWDSEKTVCNSFSEAYESADEHCSWSNTTIADLYPEMVKTMSRLMHNIPYKASSRSQIKRYGYRYWHTKKTKFNTATARVRKFKPLKHNYVLAITKENEKMDHTFVSESSVTSPTYHNTDEMKMDSSDPEDYSHVERDGQHYIGPTIFPDNLSGRNTFPLKSLSWIPSSSEHARKGQHFEESSAVSRDDLGTTFDLTEGNEIGVTRIMSFKSPAYFNLALNTNTNQHLQTNRSSPAKSPCRLFRNHEVKFFPATGSLQRSQSFSQFLVSHSRIKIQQKSEDAFEKMYKELCCPQLQKSIRSSNLTQFGDELLKPELSDWTMFHQKLNKFGNRSCSEGFPKSSTFLRAARLKKYEGVQVSHTVNALVNSPVRTLPMLVRTKRVANFSNEDFLSSPVKRLKNISESFSSRVHQKLPDWESINLDTSGVTLTLDSPNSSSWPSKKLDSNHTFLVGPSTYMHESGIVDDYEYMPNLLPSYDSRKRMENCSRRLSKKLCYNEGKARYKYMEEVVCKNYQRSFSEECRDEMS